MGNICDIFNKHQDEQYSYNIPIAITIDTPIDRPIDNQITDLSNNKTGLSESESRKSQNIYKPSDPIPIPIVNAIPISSPLNSFNENSYRYPQKNQNQYENQYQNQYQNQHQQQPHIVVIQNRQHDDVFNTFNGFFTGMLLGEILSDDCL